MIKIDIGMPTNCESCRFCQIAFESDLFNDYEPYCCIESESVDKNIKDNMKPEWCPLIECPE